MFPQTLKTVTSEQFCEMDENIMQVEISCFNSLISWKIINKVYPECIRILFLFPGEK